MWKKLAATTALGLVLSSPAFADFEKGINAYSASNYGTAYQEFNASAEQGDPASQYMLGQLYQEGLGVRQDYVQAHMWYDLAAAKGQDRALESMRTLERYMTSSQIADARTMATRWASDHAATNQAGLAFSVQNAQTVLNKLGYNAGPADGIMGPSTRSAIRTYQSDRGLSITGNLTRDLFDRMQTDLSGGQQQEEAEVSSTVIANTQSELRQRGYDVPVVSGQLDAKTQAAIRAYQEQSGMQVTGRASQALLDRLQASQGPSDTQSRQELVRTVQAELNDLGYNGGPTDGVFGPTTRNAVRAYQADNNLPVAGEVSQSLLIHMQDHGSVSDKEREQRDMALAVEEELSRRGYNTGTVDGVVDSTTRTAVRTYQSDAGVAIDGQVDAELLASLRTDPQDQMERTELISQIQTELNRLGYSAGPADGAFGPSTRRAIVTYQSDMNMRVTGEASENLLADLRNTSRNNASGDQNTGAMADAELIQQIEDELTRLGWDVGTPDGEWGGKSRNAAREFQSKIGVPVDGKADEELLAQLQNSYRQGDAQTIIMGLAQQFLQSIGND
jgi:peptidoglycan hydrolase-like protein with peptidoglycan-binding domain